MRKVIVVFANSVKHGKHCAAGKEIQTKRWIRPVGDAEGAELASNQCVCVNPYGKYSVKPLQKVEIDIAAHSPLINQPENYLVCNGEWKQRYKIEALEVAHYLDAPDTLWGTGTRVAFSQIESGATNIEQSLYLVKVLDLNIYKNMDNKRRASFSYNGNSYDFPVTDPNFEKWVSTSPHRLLDVPLYWWEPKQLTTT